jgi:hypothetical protein
MMHLCVIVISTHLCVDKDYKKLGAVFTNKCSAVVRITAGIKTENEELVIGIWHT